MKFHWLSVVLIFGAGLFLISCDKDDDVTGPGGTQAKTADIEVGGETQPNQVYFNLNTGTQTVVNRDDWDLALHCGIENRAVLNSSVGMLAMDMGVAEFGEVTGADTVGLGAQFDLDAIFAALFSEEPPAWLAQTSAWFDDPAGDLQGTAIAEVMADPASNNVYLINRGKDPDGNQRGWLKVKIHTTAIGYEVEYGDIDAVNGQSIELEKDPDFNFVFLHFENGQVNVEPPKDDWHICFTTYTIVQNFGFEIPYLIKDYVIHNRASVASGENVLVNGEDVSSEFEDFSNADIPTILFKTNIDAIGSSWRTVANPQVPGSVTGVKTDRFYLVQKDFTTTFKLLFTGMLNTGGERGYPRIRYIEL